MKRLAIPAMILLTSCGAVSERGAGQAKHDRDVSISQQMKDHDDYLAAERAIDEALNLPGGPDYAAAVRIVERSDRSAIQQDYDIGGLLLSACRDRVAYCKGASTAALGVARLARVATTPGEDSQIAAGDLALWYSRGAGDALAPDARRAACWTAVRDGKAAARNCTGTTALR